MPNYQSPVNDIWAYIQQLLGAGGVSSSDSTQPMAPDPSSTAGEPVNPGGPGSGPPGSSPGNAPGIKYASDPNTGPDAAWQAANPGPWNYSVSHIGNQGQTDNYGNVYYPVNNSLWNGQFVDPSTFPGRSTGTNSQLWGGPTSDSAPAWLQKIVQDAAAMPNGPEKTARIQHIMSSLVDPQAGANAHDVNYAEIAFGLK